MATGTLAPTPKPQFFTNAGVPLAGGKLTTTAAGTTTPLSTYTDVGLTVANANPVILDAAGRCTLFLGPYAYKFTLTDASDVQVWTQDNVLSVAPYNVDLDIEGTAGETLAAGTVVYLATGAGGTTAGRWYLAAASAAATSTAATQLGMVQTGISTAASGSVRVQGRLTGLTGLTAGSVYYVSETSGTLTATAPTYARPVGVADTTTSLVLYAASPTTRYYADVLTAAQVGIGTASPASALHVVGLVTADQVIVASTLAAGTYSLNVQGAAGAARNVALVGVSGVSNGFTVNYTGTAMEYAFISGNVGIGTASPGNLLTVNAADGVMDNAYVANIQNNEATAGRNYGLYLRGGTSASDNSLYVRNLANSDLFVVRGDGNVGIGVASPSATLHVVGTALVTSGLDVRGSITNGGGAPSPVTVGENLYVTGDVGIGVATPSATLHVVGTALVTSGLDVRGSITNGTGGGGPSPVTVGENLYVIGDVGIGVATPSATLHVRGTFRYETATNIAGGFTYSTDDGVMYLNAAGVLKVLLRANGDSYFTGGNVGIGTASPTAALHVVGTALVTSGLDVRGSITNGGGAPSPVTVGENLYVTGNLGVGIQQPAVALSVAGAAVIDAADGVADNDYAAEIYNREATAGRNFGLFVLGGSDTTDSVLYLQNKAYTDLMRVTGAGYVGIGTASPAMRLDIADGALQMLEMAPPAGAPTNAVRLYAQVDAGTGRTNLWAVFQTGAAQLVAAEPAP